SFEEYEYSLNKVLSDKKIESFFNNEIVDGEMQTDFSNLMPNEKETDKIINEASNIEEMLSISSEFALYF
ncbi:14897_t:CDS:1, partial [Racocetra persica]